MEYLRQFQNNYITKAAQIWENLKGPQDGIDGTIAPKSLFEHLEPFLVKLQELGLWTNPTNSGLALLTFHGLYFCLYFCCSSFLYTAAWACLIGFLYTTWTQRIWPVIRVDELNTEDFTPMNPECLTAPEMRQKFGQILSKLSEFLERLQMLRNDRPGKFCLLLCLSFAFLAYFGRFVSLSGLFYYFGLAILTGPFLFKILMQYPAVNCFVETVFSSPKVQDETDHVETNATKEETGSYLNQVVAQGSNLISDFSKVLTPKDEQNEITEAEDDIGLNPLEDGKILDEIDSGQSLLMHTVSEQERTTELLQPTAVDENSKDGLIKTEVNEELQSLDSLSPFTTGLEAMPSHDVETTCESNEAAQTVDDNEEFLPTFDDSNSIEEQLSGQDSLDQQQDDELLPKSSSGDSIPSESQVYVQPKLRMELSEPSSEDEDIALDTKMTVKDTTSLEQRNVMMLESALLESQARRESKSSESSSAEDFELITQEELNLVEESKN